MRWMCLLLMAILLAGCITPAETPKPTPKPSPTAPPPITTPPPPPPTTAPQTTTPPPPKPGLRALWSYKTGGEVYGVAVAQDHVAAVSWDGRVRLLAINGSLLWEKKLLGSVEDVGMRQNGAYLAVTSFLYPKGKLYLLDEKGKILWERDVPQSKGVDVDDDGQVVVASTDGVVRLFSRNGAPSWEFKLEKSAWGAWDVALGSGGVAVGGDDAYVYLLEPGKGPLWRVTAGERSYLYGVAISDGRVAAASQDWYVYLYESGSLRWKYKTGGSNYGVAVTQGYVAVGSWDNSIYLLDMDGRLLGQYPMAGHVNRLSFSPDGRYLAAGSSDGSVYLFSLS